MAEYVVHGEVGVIQINNAPANALNLSTTTAIRDCVRRSAKDDTIAAVICGKGKNFSVGADVNTFATIGDVDELDLQNAVDALEDSKKPVIAAIAGYALGGGLLLTLGCHYRIATTDAVLGFPEVNLGLLPASGGTQRFPRLVGLDEAMRWIAFGKQYSAEDARKIGAIDFIVEDNGQLLQTALQFAIDVAKKPLLRRRISLQPVKDADKADEIAEKHFKFIRRKLRGQQAPVICVNAVKLASSCSFEDGVKKEGELFRSCVNSTQSRALVYSFFREKQLKKWAVPGTGISWQTSKPLPISSAAVIGLGVMGCGIVINFLKAGIPVIVKEQNSESLSSGMRSVTSKIDKMQNRGVVTPSQSLAMKKSVTSTESYKDFCNVDIVVEAVFEEIDLKNQVFKALDTACKPSAILATNTSLLDIDRIASFTKRPGKVMGMHFAVPADISRCLENVYGRETSGETIATCMDLGRRLGKASVLVKNCFGFVLNRMYGCYTSECDFMVEEGEYPEGIDKVLTDFGFPNGRFEHGDIIGNDVPYSIKRSLGLTQRTPGSAETQHHGLCYCSLPDILYERGRLGTKVGKGWYDYNTARAAMPSPEVRRMIEDYRARNSIRPRRIEAQEVIERALYPVINEGFKILDEGIAFSPSDIDQLWIHGCSWPRHKAGPMFYAHTVGLPTILQRICYYYTLYRDRVPYWQPSKLLIRIVKERDNPPIDEWMKYSSAAGSARQSFL